MTPMQRWLAASISVFILAGIVIYFFKRPKSDQSSIIIDSTAQTTAETPSPAPTPTPDPPPTPAPTVYFPMTSYASRVTVRGYGLAVKAGDEKNFSCGDVFNGYHDGDDLEVTAAEIDQEVPIFAVADGQVLQANTVNGYGGLIVIEHNLGGQAVTAYYGHVNNGKTSVKKGDRVTAGQKITVLGDHCSAQTSGERKHLHFDIHKGSAIDVRGYVTDQVELTNWLNPKEFLTSLGAAEPK